jgi:hypothetical protein
MRKPNFDISQNTWIDVKRFYHSKNNDIDYASMEILVDKAIEHEFSNKLFASNTLALLNVSPHDKYDAHCDLLRFECVAGCFLVEYFEYAGNDKHRLSVLAESVSIEQAFDLLKENYERLKGSIKM